MRDLPKPLHERGYPIAQIKQMFGIFTPLFEEMHCFSTMTIDELHNPVYYEVDVNSFASLVWHLLGETELMKTVRKHLEENAR